MLSLYLCRHGQTACGLADVYCGDCAVKLNAAGETMAAALAAAYGKKPWAGIYASPKPRAQDMARPLAQRVNLPVVTLAGLSELRYGAWEGRTPQELERCDKVNLARFYDDPATHAPPGGETASEVAERVMGAIKSIQRDHSQGNVLVVSHKATIRILLCRWLGIDPRYYRKRFAQPLGAVNQIDLLPTGALLRSLGDIGYLPVGLRNITGS